MTASPKQLHAAFMYCVDFARQMLEERGTFYPFGAALGLTGELEARGGWTGDERPKPTEVYRLLSEGLRREAQTRKISGAALAVDVNIPEQFAPLWPDGLRVRLESEGFARYVYVAYQLGEPALPGARRQVEFAEPFTVEVRHELFVAPAG